MLKAKSYEEFLAGKKHGTVEYGLCINDDDIHPKLYTFQKAMVKWAVKKGSAAIFAGCGLGKTFMQLEWARLSGETSLIFAPLFVARQTIREAEKLGIEVNFCKDKSDIVIGVNITNYEKAQKFIDCDIDAIVLDESSILKSVDGKTRELLITGFNKVPRKLASTATPAPNDTSEIGNHAEFLGVMTRVEMLATYFVHDDGKWRLKGHAHNAFFEWMVSWGLFVNRPSDIGFDDDGYNLPPLKKEVILTDSDFKPEGVLFPALMDTIPGGLTGRTQARRKSIGHRVDEAIDRILETKGQFIIWTGLNLESGMMSARLKNKSISFVTVEGKDSDEEKADNIDIFLDGKVRVLITKVKIAGFGMNFQSSHNMIFLGMNDSYEMYYQAVRRQYRFGQKKQVNVFVIVSKPENCIIKNVFQKEEKAKLMSDKMADKFRGLEKDIFSQKPVNTFLYSNDVYQDDSFTAYLGDSVETMGEISDNSVDLSVFSPPFMSLYTYSATERDIGNCSSESDFFKHFNYIIKSLLRITKPGRRACVHVAQVAAMLSRDGFIGLKDFRGKTIQAFTDAGWHFFREVCIDKCPQAQAIRTKSKALLFTQMRKDSSWSGPALADYILTFRKPGENEIPIHPDITNEMWIEWARPIWYNIRESDTLNTREAKSNDDERHICPLQLETIERCIRLWSNKGETVFSPFMGIGSEGYMAAKLERKFIGIELKPEYYNVAVKNIKKATTTMQLTLDIK